VTDYSHLLQRLELLEAEKQIRACINSYMRQCDCLDEHSSLDNLMALFTEDAIWEGVGALYSQKLGRHEGKSMIRSMFEKYTQPPAHFNFNLHVLGNELIEVNAEVAQGEWVLIQPSDFADGRSHLNAARINCEFRFDQTIWKISHFKTQNLFSRTVDKPWSQTSDLPVPE